MKRQLNQREMIEINE
jgi:hypothetical protein